MPQKSVADEMEVVNFVPKIPVIPRELLKSFDPRFFDGSFVVGCCDNVDAAEIDEVVGAFEVLDGLGHTLKVEETFEKEVLVGALGAPVAGVEVGGDRLAGEDPDVGREVGVDHPAVVKGRNLVFSNHTFRNRCPEIQCYDVPKSTDPPVRPPSPRIIFPRLLIPNQTTRIQTLKQKVFHRIISATLDNKPVVGDTNVCYSETKFFELVLLEEFGSFGGGAADGGFLFLRLEEGEAGG